MRRNLPKVTRDVIGPGLGPDEIDRAVAELTEQGRSIYELDERRPARPAPDLIVTQALCSVCAVSVDDVRAIAAEMDPVPQIVSLDPHTLGEVLGDVRTLAQATDSKDAGVDLVQDAAARIDRVRVAVKDAPRRRVAMLEWLDPVFVGGHWVPQLIEYAGGVDLLGLAGEPSEQRSWEEVAAARPEVVIVAPCGYDVERGHAGGARLRATGCDALGAERIVIADASAWFSRPGPRLVEGLEWLGHALHPDLVPEPPGRRQNTDARRDRRRRRPPSRPPSTAQETTAGTSDSRRRSTSSSTTNVGDEAADQAAEVAADRDARRREREDEVDRQDREQARLDQVDLAVAGHHDRRAEQAVDRARGAERRRVGRRAASRPASRSAATTK